jgi:hypothetical protein
MSLERTCTTSETGDDKVAQSLVTSETIKVKIADIYDFVERVEVKLINTQVLGSRNSSARLENLIVNFFLIRQAAKKYFTL